MGIKEFIQGEILLPRIKQNGVLVVYDPERRYRELCQNIKADGLQVVDASESSIESRETALKTLGALGAVNATTTGLLVYVPAPIPLSDEDRQRDPFAVYTVCGNVFPEGDGDEYLSLCLKAKPDHATEIRSVFENEPNPDFAVIDAVGGGVGWPALRALLGAESSRDILFILLAPNDDQIEALKAQDTWLAEARDLFKVTLGLKLKTRSKAWSTVSEELWRYLLFSEFVFDLPETAPTALADVPHASESARPLVHDLCDRLRNDQRSRDTYIDKAEAIEKELDLPRLCADIVDLGKRDTFPFEERTFFAQAVESLGKDDVDHVKAVIRSRGGSIWISKGENRQQWDLIQAAQQLIESCDDLERQLPSHSRTQDLLIDFYLNSLREADRYQREFEQAVGDHLVVEDNVTQVIAQARSRYRHLAEKAQLIFTKQLEASGWPPSGRLANADVFDQLVAPRLKESGHRVAYLMVDALRYELGLALYQQLAEEGSIELQDAYAQLPSITKVGMASLLPGASKGLFLAKKNEGFVPKIGDSEVGTVPQRMEIFRKQYGDRFEEMWLNDFVQKKKELPSTVHLLVLRSVDIDSQLENNPETTLSLVHDTLKRIRVAMNRLEKAGFHEVIIVTDHGFFLNAQADAGDVGKKPPGAWIKEHERILLGDGSADDHNFVVSAESLGVRGDFAQAGGPRTMAPYRSGMLYFHGGASLQEAVVPVLIAKLEGSEQPAVQQASVVLGYKSGATRITTRLPVVQVLLVSSDMFSQGVDFEILLEAHDKKGNVIGEAKSGEAVNAATGTITLRPGEQLPVTLRMQIDFEGKFSVKALNPKTLAAYDTLELKTDYAV